MMIFSGNIAIEYGVTPAGQFFEKHQIGRDRSYIRSTPNPERFLLWMIQSEIDEEIERQRLESRIKVLSMYWRLTHGDTIRGTFNKELYLKIIQAKKENGTLHR